MNRETLSGRKKRAERRMKLMPAQGIAFEQAGRCGQEELGTGLLILLLGLVWFFRG